MIQQQMRSRQTGITRWIPLVLLLVIVALIAGGGWWGQQQWQALSEERQMLAEHEERLASQAASQTDLEQALNEQQQAFNELRQLTRQLNSQMEEDRRRLSEVASGGQDMWIINESRALASLASQRLMLTQDAQSARRLLQAADETLRRLDDPKVLPAREALAVDMEKLSGAMRVDVQGMVLRLGALRQISTELAVPVEVAPPQRQRSDDEDSVWRKLADRLPVTVRQHEGPIPLPLSGAQAALVRLSLDGGLQQAQLALMQGRVDAYEQALAQVATTVEQWFRTTDPRAAQLLAAIEELSGAMASQALPEIGQGLAAIERLRVEEAER